VQALSKSPTMSRARRQHLSPLFLLCPSKSETVFMASAVDLSAVKQNSSGYIFLWSRGSSLASQSLTFQGIFLEYTEDCAPVSFYRAEFGLIRFRHSFTLAFFHTFRKQPTAKRLLNTANRNFGKYLCSPLTMFPLMSFGPHIYFRLVCL
jgi:hypothetical protein